MKKSKTALRRKALAINVGGFRPPEDPMASWLGKVNVALEGEEWPETDGRPMHALCQLNLTELPFKPAALDGLAMITIFIGPDTLPVDQPNGTNWCLRAYSSAADLRPLQPKSSSSNIKPFPLRAGAVSDDFPSLDDAELLGIDVDDSDEYQEKFPNIEGFKLGGWPTLIQSPIEWNAHEGCDGEPEFVFQIDSNEKAHWQWGHGGVGYFARCKMADKYDQWLLSWQTL